MILLFLLIFFFPTGAHALYDPLTVPNNKYGIHVADTNDIPDTAPLVNSTGGDWGYVTVVIQENDRDPGKWQKILNQMRRLHLIPIIRLATYPEGDTWVKPRAESIESWVQFLNSLNWPIENRYIVLFNEPNHAKEWGNTIDPEGYADLFVQFAKKLKNASEDFFILPAGLDASAQDDAADFLRRMVASKPEILTIMDGWTSHSYPNPGFSGSPLAVGRGTLRSYLWELGYLRSLGLSKNLPVFITETGWVRTNPENLRIAASTVWQDPVIVAVTPFVFNYPSYPFEQFSWRKPGSNEYYPHYFSYQELPKKKGEPKQVHSFVLETALFPKTLVASSHYTFEVLIKNTGQAIVGTSEGYEMLLESEAGDFSATFEPLATAQPDERTTIGLTLNTPKDAGNFILRVYLTKGSERFLLEEAEVALIPPPSLDLSVRLGWRRTSHATDVTVLVYDHETLLHTFSGLKVQKGTVNVDGLTSVVPGRKYRIVLLVPSYVPRQKIAELSATTTTIRMPRLLPNLPLLRLLIGP